MLLLSTKISERWKGGKVEGDDIRAMERSNFFLNHATVLADKSIFSHLWALSRVKKSLSLALGVCGSVISTM